MGELPFSPVEPSAWPSRVVLDAPGTLRVGIDSARMRLRLFTDRLLGRHPRPDRRRLGLISEGHLFAGVERPVFEQYWREATELALERRISQQLSERIPPESRFVVVGRPEGPWLDFLRVLHVLVRAHRPRVILETGVGPVGATSAFLLQALQLNGYGHLFSVDANRYQVAYQVDAGRGIPDELKGRQTLVVAHAGRSLGRLVRQLPPIDLFLHDSDHSYANMLHEFTTIWPRLRSDGFLLSDDCNNSAFDDFADRVRRVPAFVNYGGTDIGLLRMAPSVTGGSTRG
jgi:predicted O-methyltransferase YrrM